MKMEGIRGGRDKNFIPLQLKMERGNEKIYKISSWCCCICWF